MSFRSLKVDIEQRIASGTFDFTILPANFSGSIPTDDWARLNIFAPASDEIGYGNSTTNTGFVEFNIFVDEGQGETRAMEIVDELQDAYEGTQGQTTFRRGTIATKAVDTVNPNLFRVDLRIPFTRYN